jgi:hypothetical protein
VERRGSNGTEWLASDASVGEAFLADPLTTSTPLLKLFGPLNAVQLYGRPARNLPVDPPVLLQVGRDDTVGGPRSVHRLADAAPARACRRHDARLPGCPARDLQRRHADRVIADLVAWLDDRMPARLTPLVGRAPAAPVSPPRLGWVYAR